MGKKTGKFGLAMIAGAALGYAASLFVSEKRKQSHKKKLTDSFDELTSKVLSSKDKKRLKSVFDSVSEKSQTHFDSAREMFTDNLRAANKTFAGINKKKYLSAVEKTINDLKDKGELNTKQLTKLQTYLEADYEVFKETRKKLDDAA